MKWLLQHRLKLLVSLVLAAVFVWLLQAGALRFWPEPEALSAFKWWTLAGYLGLWCVVHWLRAVRWHFLLAPIKAIPMRQLLPISFVGFAAIVLLPMRTGEVVRPALVRQRGELSGWSAMGTVAAERIVDGLLLSLMLLFGITTSKALSPLPERIGDLNISPQVVPAGTYTALLLFGAAFTLMGLFYFSRQFARRLVGAVIGVVSKPLAHWLSDRVERVSLGLSFLPKPRYSLSFLAITTAYWLLNAAATLLLGYGAGLDMSYSQACVLAGVLALGIMVPNAPGFFGAFQFSVYAGLSMFFPEEQLFGAGSVLVFMLYVGQLGIIFGAALVSAPFVSSSLSAALSGDAPLEDGAESGNTQPHRSQPGSAQTENDPKKNPQQGDQASERPSAAASARTNVPEPGFSTRD